VAVFDRLKGAVLDRLTAGGLFECRHCGTTVEDRGSACPTCGSADIAHYNV